MDTDATQMEDMGADIDSLSSMDLAVLDKVVKGVDVMEIFSPARVNQLASKFGLIAGASLDHKWIRL